MKLYRLTSAIAAAAAVTASLATTPARAESRAEFFCGVANGIPTTTVRTGKDTQVALIQWKSDYFSSSGFDAETRCRLVSARFQDYYNRGLLKYLTAGRMNGEPVICVAETEGGPCRHLLFTLKRNADPSRTLSNLTQLRSRATSTPLRETGDRPYISFEEFVEQGTPTSATPLAPLPESATPDRHLW